MSPPTSQRDHLLLVAFVLSGCAALGYEILWTRLLGLALGSETLGVLGVLVGFFGGMALGSAMLHQRVLSVRNPARTFALLEVCAAAYALVSPYVLYGLADLVPPLLGETAGNNDTPAALLLSIGVAGLALLPGTFCMGATLPALVEARRRNAPHDAEGRGVGRLYAANTAGATAGVLLTVHVVLPRFGIAIGAGVLSLLGLVAAYLAMRWAREARLDPMRSAPDEEVTPGDPIDTSRDPDPEVVNERWLLLVLMAGTGLVGVGLEVVGVQVLGQLLENTVYTFADILAVYLVGTAVGAALYGRRAKEAVAGRPATVAAAMLVALALSGIGAALALHRAPGLLESLAPDGSSYGAHLLAEMVLAVVVFGIPTVLMGAVFSHLLGLLAPGGTGRAYALNTLGSALAPLVFGIYVVPEVGYRDAMFVVVYGYLFLFGLFTWFRRFPRSWQLVPIFGVIALTAVAPKSLVLVEPDEEWKVLDRRETAMGLVIVSEHTEQKGKTPLRRLQVGHHFRMGGAFAFGERRMGHLPLLLHPEAKDALFLGIGTGATLGAVVDSDLSHVDAVELIPAVLDELPFFDPINREVRNDARVKLHAADARRFVAASSRRYDLVVADLFHPGRDGAGGLYAREHFENVRDILAEGGLFAQWLPLYQLDEPTLKTIVATFLEVFPEAHAMLGIYNVSTPAVVLVGRNPANQTDWLRIDVEAMAERLRKPIYQELLMADMRDVLASYLLDRAELEEFAGDAPLNTDLHPRVLLEAPKTAYTSNPMRGWDNLRYLLYYADGPPPSLLEGGSEESRQALVDDTRRFASALQSYLTGEGARLATGNAEAVPSEALDAYLRAYEYAPEFAPARGMLYATAMRDPSAAEQVLPKMIEKTPDEPRVWQAWLAHLQRIGDQERFGAARAEAEARFANPSTQGP